MALVCDSWLVSNSEHTFLNQRGQRQTVKKNFRCRRGIKPRIPPGTNHQWFSHFRVCILYEGYFRVDNFFKWYLMYFLLKEFLPVVLLVLSSKEWKAPILNSLLWWNFNFLEHLLSSVIGTGTSYRVKVTQLNVLVAALGMISLLSKTTKSVKYNGSIRQGKIATHHF